MNLNNFLSIKSLRSIEIDPETLLLNPKSLYSSFFDIPEIPCLKELDISSKLFPMQEIEPIPVISALFFVILEILRIFE